MTATNHVSDGHRVDNDGHEKTTAKFIFAQGSAWSSARGAYDASPPKTWSDGSGMLPPYFPPFDPYYSTSS